MKLAIALVTAVTLTSIARLDTADACGFAREHVTATLSVRDLERALGGAERTAQLHLVYPKFELTGDYLYGVDLPVQRASLGSLGRAVANERHAYARVELVEVRHGEWRLVSWSFE